MISRMLYRLDTQQNNGLRCQYHHSEHIGCYLLQTISEGYNCMEYTCEESCTEDCASIFSTVHSYGIMLINSQSKDA